MSLRPSASARQIKLQPLAEPEKAGPNPEHREANVDKVKVTPSEGSEKQGRNGHFRTWVIEERRETTLQQPLCAIGPHGVLPTSFRSGPVFTTLVRGGYVEPSSGFAFTADRRFIHESGMNERLRNTVAERYSEIDFSGSKPLDGTPFIVSNQRTFNFCRWWLDQVAKYFIFDAARPQHGIAAADMRYVSGEPTEPFQKETLSLLNLAKSTEISTAPLLRGDFFISSGLTFRGGQNISPQVNGFRSYALGQVDKFATAPRPQTPSRFYVSRAKTSMRRILNEAELDPILERNGFTKVMLEDLSIAHQIELFRRAAVIVSPHGAGLTTIMFCRPGTRILEIFPQNGLHSSAFMRLATLCGLPYGYVCGKSVENRASAKNPNNADIFCPPDAFETALREVVQEL